MPADPPAFLDPAAMSARLPGALRRLAGTVRLFVSLLWRRRPELRPDDLSDHLLADLGLERWRDWQRDFRDPG